MGSLIGGRSELLYPPYESSVLKGTVARPACTPKLSDFASVNHNKARPQVNTGHVMQIGLDLGHVRYMINSIKLHEILTRWYVRVVNPGPHECQSNALHIGYRIRWSKPD